MPLGRIGYKMKWKRLSAAGLGRVCQRPEAKEVLRKHGVFKVLKILGVGVAFNERLRNVPHWRVAARVSARKLKAAHRKQPGYHSVQLSPRQ